MQLLLLLSEANHGVEEILDTLAGAGRTLEVGSGVHERSNLLSLEKEISKTIHVNDAGPKKKKKEKKNRETRGEA